MIELCDKCGARFPTGRLEACPLCLLTIDTPELPGLELQEEIGRGGMGAVYKAKHLRLGRTVAVKLLPAELAAQPEFQSRFEREGRTLAMLNHPNIVTVHDAGQEGDHPFIVMEYIEGSSVAGRMPRTSARAVEIASQVCDALTYAHSQGVVHRDIKPENILIDGAGHVKVTDFGIARLISTKGWTITSDKEAIGTPHYMSPEALDGAPPDPRMDIYSLGVVLYQMVMGKLPIGSFEPAPPPIDAVVRQALSSDPAKRFATADEFKRALHSPGVVDDELTSDELTWLRAVAMLQSVSTGVALWAFLVSVTPKIMKADEMMPLIMIGEEKLPDGRILSRARFEMWPTIAACATFAVAILAYGLLRRHWRIAGLERVQPDRAVPESKTVLVIGLIACVVYGIRLLLEGHTAITRYIPVFGAVIEIAALYYLWVTILKAWRIARPLRREPLLWIGFAIALMPPVTNLLRDLTAWKP